MGILRKLFGTKTNYDAILNKSDLIMARNEIADFHRIVNTQAEAEGGAYVFKKEYVAALEAFAQNPNIDSARGLLEVAPQLLPYFEDCSPGGSLYETNNYLSQRTKSRSENSSVPANLTEKETTLLVMLMNRLNSPRELEAIRSLATEEGVNFDKLLVIAQGLTPFIGN